ncbi:hypothetical protein K3495_g5020 [Podosphaera aphanis]|nr:hypothetical protein K3495_g5020 [Podosphaera aphanis]
MKSFVPIVLYLLRLALDASASQVTLTSNSHHNVSSLLPNAIERAPDIFNALHSAMRQWGSSLKHNGMSYFPVTVPANVRLYHGARTATPQKGPEWLSFEIEHATPFAKMDLWFPPGERLPGDPPPPIEKYNGYIHNYRTIRPITKLLYLDGLSSGLSMMGTLDTQDRVLLKHSNFTKRPGFRDLNRALELCNLSPDVEGIVRMEMGFEIIICDFTSNLQFLDALPIEPQEEGLNREDLVWRAECTRGITHRYGGIAAGRVIVDYSSMVSAFFYPLNLTNPDHEHSDLPRIPLEGDDETIQELKNDVLEAFKNRKNWQQSIDWQGVVDLIVTRYSDVLLYLPTPEMSRQDMLIELKFLLEHFIDFSTLDITAARHRCATHYLVPRAELTTSTDHLINQAILTVSERICDVLFDARKNLIEHDSISHTIQAKISIENLMNWLDWTTRLECGKCALNEICYAAMWPFGTKQDHEKPQCISMMVVYSREGYWDYGS